MLNFILFRARQQPDGNPAARRANDQKWLLDFAPLQAASG
jgi:hypothetical protein